MYNKGNRAVGSTTAYRYTDEELAEAYEALMSIGGMMLMRGTARKLAVHLGWESQGQPDIFRAQNILSAVVARAQETGASLYPPRPE